MSDWLEIHRGDAPLVVSFPHTGTDLPTQVAARLISPWLARKDADWWIERLYDFAAGLGATVIRTTISRTVIDVNRDPSGKEQGRTLGLLRFASCYDDSERLLGRLGSALPPVTFASGRQPTIRFR